MNYDHEAYLEKVGKKPFVQGVLISTAKFFLSWGALWLIQLAIVLYLVFEIATFPADISGIVGIVLGLAVMTYAQYRAVASVFVASQVTTIEAVASAFTDTILEGLAEGSKKAGQ